MTVADAHEVLAIYQAGLDTGHASFDTDAPDWTTFDNACLPGQRFVAVNDDGQILGWIAVKPVSPRVAYAGVVEHSVYIGPSARGQGVGKALLDKLIASTEAAGIWTIQSGVFPENTASLALHAKCGFRVVGTRAAGRQPSRPVARRGAAGAAQPGGELGGYAVSSGSRASPHRWSGCSGRR